MKGGKALSIVLTLALVLTLLPIGAMTAGAAAVAEVQLSGNPTILPQGQTTGETYNVYFKIEPVINPTHTDTLTTTLTYTLNATNPLNLTVGKTYAVEYDSNNNTWKLKDGATVVATSTDGKNFTDGTNSGDFSSALPTTATQVTMDTATQATVTYTVNTAQSRAVLSVVDSNGKTFVFQADNDATGKATVDPRNSDSQSIKLFTDPTVTTGKLEFTIPIKVKAGQEGTGSLYLKIAPVSSQDQFPATMVELAKFETAQATVSVVSGSKSFGDSGVLASEPVIFQISEPVPGVLRAGDQIKISLPDGFKWNGVSGPNVLLGPSTVSVAGSGSKDITITINNASNSTTGRYLFNVSAGIDVNTQVARKGDVIVAVGGAKPATLTIGRYGDYQVNVTGEPEDVWAGRYVETGKIAGKIVLDELLPKSLIDGRTIILTLPDGAEWPVVDSSGKLFPDDPANVDTSASAAKIFYFPASNKQGLVVTGFEQIDGDYRIAKLKVQSPANPQAGKTVIEVRQVAVDLGFKEGPLTVEVSGNAGANGKATLSNVKPLFNFSVENKRDVVIGARNQVIGDIVIKENQAGALRGGYNIELWGERYLTEFTGYEKVEVRSGDVEIGSPTKGTDDKGLAYYYFPVKHASTEASEIVIKGVKLTLDRTTPEGDLKVTIKGKSVTDYGSKSIYPARVITPADQTREIKAKFTIDSMSYVVNGETKAMDVAPFIKDNRTFVPVKYVAEALGVKESDIIWNPYAKSVTIFKGDRVIQLKIGSKTLLVNGATIEMDTAPEIKDARTVLPIAWVAKALNVDYVWNDAERSVEFNYVAR